MHLFQSDHNSNIYNVFVYIITLKPQGCGTLGNTKVSGLVWLFATWNMFQLAVNTSGKFP